jgi:hypothetical protein
MAFFGISLPSSFFLLHDENKRAAAQNVSASLEKDFINSCFKFIIPGFFKSDLSG